MGVVAGRERWVCLGIGATLESLAGAAWAEPSDAPKYTIQRKRPDYPPGTDQVDLPVPIRHLIVVNAEPTMGEGDITARDIEDAEVTFGHEDKKTLEVIKDATWPIKNILRIPPNLLDPESDACTSPRPEGKALPWGCWGKEAYYRASTLKHLYLIRDAIARKLEEKGHILASVVVPPQALCRRDSQGTCVAEPTKATERAPEAEMEADSASVVVPLPISNEPVVLKPPSFHKTRCSLRIWSDHPSAAELRREDECARPERREKRQYPPPVTLHPPPSPAPTLPAHWPIEFAFKGDKIS